MKIGIDFSINSTGIAIQKGDEIKLFSFVPNYKPHLSSFKMHKELSDLVKIISYEKLNTTKNPIEDQTIKLKNADLLSNTIISSISPFIEEPLDIRIEGFSFGSKGNSFIDLVIYNTFLKSKIIEKWGHCISVIPPKSLKKAYTGNGNASKCDMLRKFLEKNQTLIKDRLIEIGLNKEGEFLIPKPIDDLCDAWALVDISL